MIISAKSSRRTAVSVVLKDKHGELEQVRNTEWASSQGTVEEVESEGLEVSVFEIILHTCIN